MFLRRLWMKLWHPQATGQFTPRVTKAFGVAVDIAARCGESEVRPIHLLFGLIHGSDPSETWLNPPGRDSALAALEHQLAPEDAVAVKSVPASEPLSRIVRLLASTAQDEKFFIDLPELRAELFRSNDHEVGAFVDALKLKLEPNDN